MAEGAPPTALGLTDAWHDARCASGQMSPTSPHRDLHPCRLHPWCVLMDGHAPVVKLESKLFPGLGYIVEDGHLRKPPGRFAPPDYGPKRGRR